MHKIDRSTNQYHINPKFRAYGKARLDIAQRAGSEEDWQRLWKKPSNPFPFAWEGQWKQCIEYRVDDFPAEVGFFIDILGLPVNAIDPDYAMFTSPSGDFFFSVVPASEDLPSTPPEAIRIQFMVADIQETALELEQRGIPFEMWPQPYLAGSSLFIGYFRTPHGICVDLWGTVQVGDEGYKDERVDPARELVDDAPLHSNLPEEPQFDEDDISPPQDDLNDEQPSSPESGQRTDSEELIHFNMLEEPEDSRQPDTGSTEDSFPQEADDPEDELIELEYEYIDDEV